MPSGLDSRFAAVPCRLPRVCAVVFALTVSLCSARAQDPGEEPSKLDPPDLERYRRWGPVWARPGVEISNLGYDTNILVSPPGEEVPDYTATISPRLEGLVLFGHTAFLTFREQLDYTAYLENPGQNYPNNRFRARATVPAERIGVFVEAGLDNFQDRPTDLEDIRTRRRDRTLEAGLILEPGPRTEIEISGVVHDQTNRDPDDTGTTGRTVGEVLDRQESSVVLESAWRAAGRTKLLFEAGLQGVDFVSPGSVQGVAIDRDGNSWRLLPGVRFGEGGRLEGEASIGWGRYSPKERDLPEFSDWIGNANLAYLVGWRTRLILTGERIPGFSLIEGSPYYLSATVGLRAVHYLTRVVGLEAGASRGTLTFPGSFAVEERIDRLRNWDGGVRLRMFQGETGGRLEYSVRVTHYDRESTAPGVARSVNTLAMGVVAGF